MFAPTSVLGQNSGTINGQLLDVSGEPLRIRNAFAFLCDAKTGYPLLAKSKKIIGRTNGFGSMSDWVSAESNADGKFTIDDVPPGTYRIVAQSWTGRDSIPSIKEDNLAVMLHGSAEGVNVKSGAVTSCTVKALGSSGLRIRTEPDEGHAYLFLSLKPTLGEPILGPMLWGDDFTTHIMSAVHLRQGNQTYFGLPDNSDVHVMLLNYDNNAGMGGVTTRTKRLSTVTLPIYATWSNGYHTPPERLQPLVEWIRNHQQRFTDLMNKGLESDLVPATNYSAHQLLYQRLADDPDKTVDIPQLGTFTMLDAFAAQSYLRILQSHEQRKK